MTPPTILTLLPERLRADVARAAAAAATTPEAWVERAVERQLGDQLWRRVLAYGEARAEGAGYTEADVERVIVEARAEARREGGADTPPTE